MISQEWREEMQRFGQSCYDEGYRQGLLGKEYTGRTFIGYYGWLDGSFHAIQEKGGQKNVILKVKGG